jgi:hypothetical protein
MAIVFNIKADDIKEIDQSLNAMSQSFIKIKEVSK